MTLPSASAEKVLRILVVDDSAFMRRAIERILAAQPGMAVAGVAADGIEAVQRALELRPDVITMDVEMPRLDGVGAVREIMQAVPTPIVMLSTKTTTGAETTLRALDAGAVNFVAKPGPLSADLASLGDALRAAILAASEARVRRRPASLGVVPEESPERRAPPHDNMPAAHLIVIGASSGGPPALAELVSRLPAGLGAAVLIVQHLPAGFTAALAHRLDTISALPVAEAVDGEALNAGRILVAPGGVHTVVGRDRRLHFNEAPPVHGVRPSIDVALDSATQVFGRNACVAILTGMGRDGAEGAARLQAAGGKVFTQDEASSLIYGMPRATHECTPSAMQAAPAQLGDWLAQVFPQIGVR